MKSSKLNMDDEAHKGSSLMEWVRRSMPLTQDILDELNFSGNLHIGLIQHIEPKVGRFCMELKNKGLQVSICLTNNFADKNVLKALRLAGIHVFDDIQAFLNAKLDVILDDSTGELFKFPGSVKGVVTLSTKSHLAAADLQEKDELQFPVVNLNNISIIKQLGSVLSSGQSCVMALLDITNLQLVGRTVLVTGYNISGQSIAAHAAAMGAKVSIVERDPILALKAAYEGYSVTTMDEIASSCEVIFTTLQADSHITPEHMKDMPDGVILCETSRVDKPILCQNYLDSLAPPVNVREFVAEYRQADGKRLQLITGGLAVDLSGAEGNTIENIDMYLALQLLAIKSLIKPSKALEAKVYDLSLSDQYLIARAKLRSLGATIEVVT